MLQKRFASAIAMSAFSSVKLLELFYVIVGLQATCIQLM